MHVKSYLFSILLYYFIDKTLAKGNKTSICSRCQCLSLTPFLVDCDDMNLTEIPELYRDLKVPWRFRALGNSIKTVPVFPHLENLTEIILRFGGADFAGKYAGGVFEHNYDIRRELATFNLLYNTISNIEDGAFLNLTNLKVLNLAHNNLTEDSLTSESFKGPYQNKLPDPLPLEELNLSSNKLKRLPKQVFKHLTNLTSLDLSHNPFIDISITTAEALSELQGLKKLSLASTKLKRLPIHFFSELLNLQELDLSGNDFLTVPSEVNYAHSLMVLSLNDNLFEVIHVHDFWDTLSLLETLNLKNSKTLFRVEDGAFGNLTSLKVLDMSGNRQLATILPLAFYNRRNQTLQLKELHLQNNALEYLAEETLDWKKIKYLDLQDNPWNCDCKFEWVAKSLFPVIQELNYDLTLHITCAYPTELMGQNVGSSLVQNHKFVCRDYERNVDGYGFVVIATIVVGTLLLVTGSIIFSYVLFRRTKVHEWVGENVKYRRAMNEDEEIITSNIQY